VNYITTLLIIYLLLATLAYAHVQETEMKLCGDKNERV
jgi:hypothetical protein